jgi:hypothetical protein
MPCQYSTFKLKRAALFEDCRQPWRKQNFACPVPSMMVDDELQFLHYLTSRHYGGAGAIVDFGPLAGSSTYCLASGLHGQGHIFSYDLWHFSPSWEVFFPGSALRQGDNILPLFLEYIAPYRHRVTEQKGDLTEQRWSHGPIEIMFIDAAKSPKAMWHIVNEFFPSLIPGSFVLHQDYISAECPWIHMAVGLIADYFEYCDSPHGGTVCVRLKKKIPPGLLVPDYFDRTPREAARALIASAGDALIGWYRLCVRMAEANYLVYKQAVDQAAEILEDVLGDPSFATGVQYDIDLVRSAIMNERMGRRRAPP